jgi:hypothetical protein
VAAALALLAPSPVRGGDELDPEEDPSLRVPDVARLDLETMGEGIDLSDENWDGVEGEIPAALAKGQVRAVLRATKGRDAVIAFALRPSTGLLLHRETLRRLRALRNADPVGFGVLVARERATALLIDRLKTRTPVHECASAYGHLAHEAGRMVGGDRPDLAVVKAGVATLRRHEARLGVGVAEWKEVLLPALAVGRTLDDSALVEWALAEVALVVAGKDADPEVARLMVILDLDRGTRLAATSPAEAGPLLARAFAALSGKGALPASDETLVYHFNAAVTAAKRASLPLDVDWRMRTVTGSSLLRCEVPLAVGWIVEEASGAQDLVLRRGGGVGRGEVTLVADVFSANQNYTTEDGKLLDGDSMAMIVKDRQRRMKSALREVTRETATPSRLSRALQPRTGWELAGRLREGRPVHVREWGLKVGRASEKFVVLRLVETDPVDDDPELARVLDSLAERKPGR